ncbi:MAG: hypothetical protein VCD00_17565 [Candidatus Hydrogenedentota bacterium]
MSGRLRAIGIVAVFLLIGMIVLGVLRSSSDEASIVPFKQVNLKGNPVPVFEFDEASSNSGMSETTVAVRSEHDSRNFSEHNPRKQSLTGKVVSALDGKAITEFKLLLVIGDYTFAMEDDFRFYYPPRGEFNIKRPEKDQPMALHVRAPGYLESIVPVNVGGDENSPDELLVRLESEYIVSGRVIDQNGVAIEGAMIFDTRIPTAESKQRALAIARSDKEGEFILEGLRTNEITLCAYRKGLSADLRVVPLEHHSTRVEMVLREGGAVAGKAMLDGSPVQLRFIHGNFYATAQGQLDGEIAPDIGRVDISGYSDLNGEYRFEGIPAGQGYIQASILHNGRMRDMSADVEVKPGMTTRVDFPFPTTSSSVEGYVVPGEGLANPTQVKLSLDTGEHVESMVATCEENGYYQFSDLPPGRVMVSIFSQEHVKFAMGELGKEETLRLDLHLIDGTDIICNVHNVEEDRVVFGILLPAGLAIPDRLDRMFFTRLTRSSSGKVNIRDGRIEFRRVDSGSYTLLVVSHHYGFDEQIDYASMQHSTHALEIDDQETIEVDVSF